MDSVHKTLILLALVHFGIQIWGRVNGDKTFVGNPYRHKRFLDPEGKFVLEYIADPRSSNVIVNITAETRGYVALGLSKTGKMPRSDIVIGGVRASGVPYLSDRHTTEGRVPYVDIQQDWKLLRAWENKTHTSLRMMRNMETCDPQDHPINDDTIHLMWAYGEDDTIDYHFKNRGSFQTHLLQPDLTPQIPTPPRSRTQSSSAAATRPASSGLDVWRLTVSILQNTSTTNNGRSWCVFQQGPELEKRYNIIGFSTSNDDAAVKMSLDRIVIYRCTPNLSQSQQTEASKQKFQQLVDYSGECQNATELFSYCKDIIYTWGKGGQDIFLPKNTGIPFGANPEEYYLLESFLSNPNQKPGGPQGGEIKEVNVDIDLLLTESPRKFEAKLLKVGHNQKFPLIIPPGALEYEVFGHCASECTERRLPRRKAMRVFGVSFDTGTAGKSVTLHQVRNAHQIPLILDDKNHDPSYQQMLVLHNETPVRSGDQITVRCTFDSTIRSGVSSPKLSSSLNISRTPERCLAYLWYYDEMSGNVSTTKHRHAPECTSMIHPIDFSKWVTEHTPKDVKRNLDYRQIFNKLNTMRWTPQLRQSFYQMNKFGRYRSSCGIKSSGPVTSPSATNRTSGSSSTNNRANNGTSASSSAAAAGDITVFPIPVQEIPYTIACPTLPGAPPALFGLPSSAIFGFP